MKVFEHNISFQSLGELYAGLKLQLITPHQILKFCKEGRVVECNDNIIEKIEKAYHHSLFELESILKSNSDIIVNDDSIYSTGELISKLPEKYLRIWKLEELLKIKNSNMPVDNKLEKIYDYYYFLNFPEDWTKQKIILYSINENNKMLSNSEIYQNFETYVENEINESKEMTKK